MKTKFIKAHMATARVYAELSPAKRLHVGAIVVKDDRIISIGYNGMPVGWDNECEYKDFMNIDAGGWLNPNEIEERWPFKEYDAEVQSNRRYRLVTKDEVLHAESNAIAKLAKSSESGLGADLFVTHAPCIHCAKLILQSGISRVWYSEDYRNDAGLDFLAKSGVTVTKVDDEEL
jgi:dCMP deaminase